MQTKGEGWSKSLKGFGPKPPADNAREPASYRLKVIMPKFQRNSKAEASKADRRVAFVSGTHRAGDLACGPSSAWARPHQADLQVPGPRRLGDRRAAHRRDFSGGAATLTWPPCPTGNRRVVDSDKDRYQPACGSRTVGCQGGSIQNLVNFRMARDPLRAIARRWATSSARSGCLVRVLHFCSAVQLQHAGRYAEHSTDRMRRP
jgi:hypothetical protein